jgi:hypothetical protein
LQSKFIIITLKSVIPGIEYQNGFRISNWNWESTQRGQYLLKPQNSHAHDTLLKILINILSLFPTRDLLPLTTLSHRIHDLILRVIHHRILAAATLSNHKVILECYHPSARLSTPYFFCEYLGTDPFDGSSSHELEGVGKLGKLNSLYSHFRPVQPEGDRKVWSPRASGGWSTAPISAFLDTEEEYVCQNVYLESHELFSQLQSVVNVVKVGPKKDIFLSYVTIGEGLTRIWRDWLAERAENLTAIKSPEEESDQEYRKRLLWSSLDEHIGLRLRVILREDMRAPVLLQSDEDPNVGYPLQYEGELALPVLLLGLLMRSQNWSSDLPNCFL